MDYLLSSDADVTPGPFMTSSAPSSRSSAMSSRTPVPLSSSSWLPDVSLPVPPVPDVPLVPLFPEPPVLPPAAVVLWVVPAGLVVWFLSDSLLLQADVGKEDSRTD